MRKFAILGAALLAAGCAMEDEAIDRTGAASARIAEALEGKVAGEPQSCVQMFQLGGNRMLGDDAILFDGRSPGTAFLNRPAGGCAALGWNRALVIRTSTTQLCRGEIVEVVDPSSGVTYGSCALGDFVPYRRP